MNNVKKFIFCVSVFLVITPNKALNIQSSTKRFHLFLDPRTWNAAYSQCSSTEQRLINLDDDFDLIEVERFFTSGEWKDVRPREFWVAMHLDCITNSAFVWSSTCHNDTAIDWGEDQSFGNLNLQCVFMSMESGSIVMHKTDCIATSKFYVCEEACTEKIKDQEGTMVSPLSRRDVSVMDCATLCTTLYHNSISCKGFTYDKHAEMCYFFFPGDREALRTSKNPAHEKDIHIMERCTTIEADIHVETCTTYPLGRCPTQQNYGSCPFSDGTFQNVISQTASTASYNSLNQQSTIKSTETVSSIGTLQTEGSGSSSEDFIEIIKEMKVHYKDTNKYKRTLVSVDDSRPLSRYFGYTGIIVLVAVVLLLFLCDVLTFYISTSDKNKIKTKLTVKNDI